MAISVPLQLVDEMPVVNKETCLNFIHFRNILKTHRSNCDDKIKQRLQSITNPKEQCKKFGENLRKAQESRRKNLNFCLRVLKEESENPSIGISKSVLEKERQLLESELTVEEIVCEQSEILFDNKYCSLRAANPLSATVMKLACTFTVLYCPVDQCDLEKPFHDSKDLLEHLETGHKVKIYENSGVAPFLDQYLDRYKDSLKDGITLGSENDTEDLKIRQSLHLKMLNGLLETQQMERNTIYKKPRMCLFCSELCSNLHELFSHMFQEHRFNIGLLDNLIFVDTFLNDLEEMTKFKKQCLFCKEIFRNGTCLRKHLKSKNHFKINGKDEQWDRFYIINYVNLVKPNSKSSSNNSKNDTNNNDEDVFIDEEDGDEWEDLVDEIDAKTQCLFCEEILIDPEGCFDHMRLEHGFNMKNIQKKHSLSFYDTMKLINYLRNCQRHETNPFAEEDCKNTKSRFERDEIPEPKLWNRPEFYFPVYEEDPLLTAIEEATEMDEQEHLAEEFNNKI